MSLVGLIVLLIVIALILWATQKILAAFGVAEPFRTLIWVGVVLLCALYVLGQIGVISSGPFFRAGGINIR